MKNTILLLNSTFWLLVGVQPAFSQATPVEKEFCKGGPFVSTGNTIQTFDAPITGDVKNAAPLTFSFFNGPNNSQKFAWVRVFLSNENSTSDGKAPAASGVLMMTEKNLVNGRFDIDLAGRLRGGRNIIHVTGAGFKGSTVSWKLSTTLSSLKVTSALPSKVMAGGTLTLSGVGFGATPADNVVYFDRTKATVTSATADSLVVRVPSELKAGASSLQLTVGKNQSNLITIMVTGEPQVIDSDWKAGPAFQSVTIRGKNFSEKASENEVKFGGVVAPVTSATSEQIVTTVPLMPDLNGSYYYLVPTHTDITVTVNGVAAKGSASFMSAKVGWQ